MTHERNTKGLAKAAKQRRHDTIKRVNEALERLSKLDKKVNFNTVSKEAQVGKPWLYQETAIRKKIESLRIRTRIINEDKPAKNTGQASEKSKDALISMLKAKVRNIDKENKKLKQQIEVLYGEIVSKGKKR